MGQKMKGYMKIKKEREMKRRNVWKKESNSERREWNIEKDEKNNRVKEEKPCTRV